MPTLSFFWITFTKKNIRADYQPQIETQFSNKKFVTIMASATGSFRFLTKKSVSNMILTLYEGFFQINFRWLFKVIFLLRTDYQAQIETQLSNKKFITIMASATGSFCFLTKKKVFITWFWLFTRGFFKTISDDFSKWYFLSTFIYYQNYEIFQKNTKYAANGA